VNQHGGIATVIDNQVWPAAIRPKQGLFRAPPVFGQGFAFPGKHCGRPLFGNGGGRMVLGTENIA
jgi:hypothetical protein